MDAPLLTPPLPRRAAFWALGWRLPVEYRAWVAHQVQRPGYQRRRQTGLLAFFAVFVGGPQLLPGSESHGWQLGLTLLPVGALAIALLVARPLTDDQRGQVLAFHGVDAAGHPVPPDARWTGVGHPVVIGLLLVMTLSVAAAGVTVAADRSSRPQCSAASPSVLAAVLPLVDKPLSAEIFIPEQFQNVHLRNPRQIGTGVRGIHYIAADVVDDRHDVLGAAAWRVIDRNNAYGWPAGVDAVNALAAEITPTGGYATSSTNGHRDRPPSCLHAD